MSTDGYITLTREITAIKIPEGAERFPNGLSGFLQVSAAAWLQNVNTYSVLAGIRKQF